MPVRAIELLRANSDSAVFGRTVDEALHLLSTSETVSSDGPSGTGQKSKDIADIHEFRSKSGYYQRASLAGLDETIESLRDHDGLARGQVINVAQARVVIYLDNDGALLGLIIFRKIN